MLISVREPRTAAMVVGTFCLLAVLGVVMHSGSDGPSHGAHSAQPALQQRHLERDSQLLPDTGAQGGDADDGEPQQEEGERSGGAPVLPGGGVLRAAVAPGAGGQQQAPLVGHARLSTPSTALLVTLCDRRYFPGAVQLLHTARHVGDWPGDMAVLVTDDVEPCMRNIFANMGVAVMEATGQWVGRRYGLQGETTSTHYAKLDLFTKAGLRRAYEKIVYMDADMKVNNNLRTLLSRELQPHKAVVAPYIAHIPLYREVSHRLTLPWSFKIQYPDRQGVFSTRLLVIDTQRLPSPAELTDRIEALFEYLPHISVNWEQGLLQFMLYREMQPLHPRWSSTFTHYYHVDLPWVVGSKHLSTFMPVYDAASDGDSSCWRPASAVPAER